MTPRETAIEAIARGMAEHAQWEERWAAFIPSATASLDALLAALPALGLKVVPVEADGAMRIGVEGDWPVPSIHFDFCQQDCLASSTAIYRAMIAAAPDQLGGGE